ncbi:hypothetical protein ABH994_006296 [Bradyrhizobium yuanmingense]|uniref:hypothetical protein n=1 Tax=Bradyrhizobium yuanmingense TaxID=108015 RepID=UPI003516EADD
MSITSERRQFIKGLLICGCIVCLLPPERAKAEGRSYCAAESGRADPKDLVPLQSYSNPAISVYVSREDDYLAAFFATRAGIYIDQSDPNAYMDYDRNLIAIGGSYLDKYAPQRFGLLKISGVLAHEESHIFQIKWKINSMLEDVRGHKIKFVELHADYLAGAYMAWRQSYRSVDPAEISGLFFELGDNSVRTIRHHGTPQERFLTFQSGYGEFLGAKQKDPSADVITAATLGLKFLRSMMKSWG